MYQFILQEFYTGLFLILVAESNPSLYEREINEDKQIRSRFEDEYGVKW